MAEWTIFGDLTWSEFVDYFWSQPLYGQILIGIGVVTLLVLLAVGVYYLVKGIIYLVYYILKGVAYLVYYILLGIAYLFYGIAKLFEWLYYKISGKEKPAKQPQTIAPQQLQKQPLMIEPIQKFPREIEHYCLGCGMKMSNRMNGVLASSGTAFCEHCGKGLKSEVVEI